MAYAIRLDEHGGPEKLLLDEKVTLGPPADGEVRIKQTFVGLNMIDVYKRRGLYPLPLPAVLGEEAAGVVEEISRSSFGVKVGDRVAYAGVGGAYCDVRNIAADRLVKIPGSVSDEAAAALMLKGMTAEYLLRRTYKVKRGDTILFHAAAGGVGLIACRWAKALGAKVIGTVGSQAKVELAKRNGCDHVLVTGSDEAIAEIPKKVRELTGGKGVPVVYDSVGRDTFLASLNSLCPRGMLVSFGNASGPVPSFEPLQLSQKGSLYLTRPRMGDYVATRQELTESAAALFHALDRKDIEAIIGARVPLKEVAKAHADLEARKTTGSTVLVV